MSGLFLNVYGRYKEKNENERQRSAYIGDRSAMSREGGGNMQQL